MEEKNDNKNNQIILENVFYGSSMSFYISRKSHKIAKAIYMITSLLKDNEPIRFSLRQICADKEFIGVVIKDKKTALELAQKLNNLIALLDIAGMTNLISAMNKDILIYECQELQNMLLDQNFEAMVSSAIPSKYFNVERKIETETKGFFKELLKDMEVKTTNEKSDNKGQNVFYKTSQPKKVLEKRSSTEDAVLEGAGVYKGQFSRRDHILSVIKNKGEVSIKDISVLIDGYSEKTIQRELNGLLSQGAIKKTGERRWSRYSLSS